MLIYQRVRIQNAPLSQHATKESTPVFAPQRYLHPPAIVAEWLLGSCIPKKCGEVSHDHCGKGQKKRRTSRNWVLSVVTDSFLRENLWFSAWSRWSMGIIIPNSFLSMKHLLKNSKPLTIQLYAVRKSWCIYTDKVQKPTQTRHSLWARKWMDVDGKNGRIIGKEDIQFQPLQQLSL